MGATEILGLIAALIVFVVYATYFRQVLKGTSIPNPATWVIWLIVMTMNAVSYCIMVESWGKSLLAICSAAFIAALFVYSLIKGKFAKLAVLEYIVIGLALVIGVFWQITKDARLANLALQAILLISFVPTAIGIIRNTAKEGPLPWVIASVSYCFGVAAVLCGWSRDWAELAFPIVNGIIGNGSIAIFALYYNYKRRDLKLATQ